MLDWPEREHYTAEDLIEILVKATASLAAEAAERGYDA